MLVFVITAIAIFVTYIAIAIKLFGIPASISNTYYLYEERHKNLGYIFTAFMLSVAFLMVNPMVYLGTFESWQLLGFVCPSGIALCGSAPFFNSGKDEKIVHCVGAITGVVSGLAWCFCLDTKTSIYVTSAMVGLSIFGGVATETEDTCKTFWLEIAGFGTIAMVLFLETIFHL